MNLGFNLGLNIGLDNLFGHGNHDGPTCLTCMKAVFF